MSNRLLNSGLDGDYAVNQPALKQVYDKVNATWQDALEEHNINPLVSLMAYFRDIQKLSGHGTAYLIWLLRSNWDVCHDTLNIDEDIWDFIPRRMGISATTCKRYYKVYQYIVANPKLSEEIREEARNKAIRYLIQPAIVVSQGYVLEPEDWESLLAATTTSEVGKVCREITGREGKKNTLYLYIDRQGNIYQVEEGKVDYAGYLDKTKEKAYNKIVGSAGIMEQE